MKTEGENKYIEVEGERISLPKTAGDKVLFGYFDEAPLVYDHGKKHHDVNNNGELGDKIPVVL